MRQTTPPASNWLACRDSSVNAGQYGTGLGSSERGWPGTVSSASVNTVLVIAYCRGRHDSVDQIICEQARQLHHLLC